MPRPKKKAESVPKQDTFSEVLPVVESEEAPTVREKHTVVTQWVQNKPLNTDLATEEDSGDDEDELDDLLPDDPILETVEEMAENSLDWSLTIYRLPSFEQDGKAGAGYKKFCGSIPIPSPSWLRHQQHLEEIQRRFARNGESNYFKIEARKGNRIKRELGVVAIEPLPVANVPGITGLPVDPNNSTINVYGNQQNPADLMDAFTKQFATFQKLQAAMLPPWAKNLDPTAMAQSQQQAASPAANTTEGALMTLLNADDELLNQAVGKLRKVFRGDGAVEEKGPWDAVVALLTSPTLPQTVSMLAQQFRAPQPDQATGSQPPDSPPPLPPDVLAQQRLLAVLTNAMRLNSDVATVLPALDGFVELFPEHRGSVEGLIAAETNQLLGMLPQFFPPSAEVVGMPHAPEWVGKLKAVYFGEGEESEPLK